MAIDVCKDIGRYGTHYDSEEWEYPEGTESRKGHRVRRKTYHNLVQTMHGIVMATIK